MINPLNTPRPKYPKRRTKKVNYQNMCNNTESDSDVTSPTDLKPKLSKLLPGTVPSKSRVIAQNFIAKHPASKGLNALLPEYSSDSDLNVNGHVTDNYDGDTEDYDISDKKLNVPITDEGSDINSVKTEPIPVMTPSQKGNTDLPVPILKSCPKPRANKTKVKNKPKVKPKIYIKPDVQNDTPMLKLSKKGSKGEWHIDKYARLKYKKEHNTDVLQIVNFCVTARKH